VTPGPATRTRHGLVPVPADDALSVEVAYRVAGLGVRITVRGRDLAVALLPALAHLRVDEASGARDLSVSIWDESVLRAGTSRLGSPDGGGARSVMASRDGRRFVQWTPAGALWLDLDTRGLAGWFQSATAVPANERVKPFGGLWAPWLREHGRQIVHAAMVVDGAEGALVAGLGGAGKSTVALAAALGGLGYVGDDQVALEETLDSGFVGHSLYASCFVERSHLERFTGIPASSRGVLDPARDKVVLQLAHALPGGTIRAAPVRTLLLPRLTRAGAGTIRPASAPDALRALAPSSLLAHPGQGQAELDRLERLVRAVPRWWLDLGGEVAEIPALVTRALAESGR
jgi:hypothetical protein